MGTADLCPCRVQGHAAPSLQAHTGMHTLARTFTDKHTHEDNTQVPASPPAYTSSHIQSLIYSEPVLVTLGMTLVASMAGMRLATRAD